MDLASRPISLLMQRHRGLPEAHPSFSSISMTNVISISIYQGHNQTGYGFRIPSHFSGPENCKSKAICRTSRAIRGQYFSANLTPLPVMTTSKFHTIWSNPNTLQYPVKPADNPLRPHKGCCSSKLAELMSSLA